eukprot:TRINITY_DN8240_c0_g1_i5.p1 TRINITY_DN8240_c0_g1~~TRINITY_DN8240_c0_g1_i5.p1  ORF type:complete len:775 (+),score=117.92 TRINITY_DN8240_c0_g1_i5:216-2327(+)
MELEFKFEGHNVVQLPDEDAFEKCDMTNAKVVAKVGQSPFVYKVSGQDALDGKLFFACSVGSHCNDNQKLVVHTTTVSAPIGQNPPASRVEWLSPAECNAKRRTGSGPGESGATTPSVCEAPVKQADGFSFVSCLSESVTLTPGGVINRARLMHTPFPNDHRVKLGLRMWEFVTKNDDGTLSTVPINQLYTHHLSGNVVLGQGAEGMAADRPDREFPGNYGMLSGEEDDWMIFHLIDLRGVDDWVSCVECRCNRPQAPRRLQETGGVSCCFNCSSTVPKATTMDYYMRYNVSYRDVREDEVVQEVKFLTADTSPAVGKAIEYDVPPWQQLPASDRLPGNPKIQHLVREDKFEALFHHDFFGQLYHGPKRVKLLRCVGHLHVAAVTMRLEDAETGEILCENNPYHPNLKPGDPWSRGTPGTSDGFVTKLSVADMWPEKVVRADQKVRFIADYDAGELHTGVMGMLFLFYSTEVNLTINSTAFEVDLCIPEFCQSSLFPPDDVFSPPCDDQIKDSPMCKFAGMCDCDKFVTAPESQGCGNMFKSQMGDVEINSVCSGYCKVCSDSDKSEMDKRTKTSIWKWLKSICEYSGGQCQAVLRNLLACATYDMVWLDGRQVRQDMIDFLKAHGKDLAMDHYKLGGSSIRHKDKTMKDIKKCGSYEPVFPEVDPPKNSNIRSQDVNAAKVASSNAWLISALSVCIYFFVRT